MSKLIFTSLSILAVCSFSRAQSYYFPGDESWKLCPWLISSYRLDSTARQASVDSAARLLVGSWRLVESTSGWGHRFKPEKATELVFNQNTECKIYEDSLLVGSIQFNLKRKFSSFDFEVDEKGKVVFYFSKSRNSSKRKGSLMVCEERLFFFTGADGPAYAFQRVR